MVILHQKVIRNFGIMARFLGLEWKIFVKTVIFLKIPFNMLVNLQ